MPRAKTFVEYTGRHPLVVDQTTSDRESARTPRPGRYTIAMKVIDTSGNDTMTLVPVTVG